MLRLNILCSCQISDSTSEFESSVIRSRREIKPLNCFLKYLIRSRSQSAEIIDIRITHLCITGFAIFTKTSELLVSSLSNLLSEFSRTRRRDSFSSDIVDIYSWHIDKDIDTVEEGS